MFFQVFQVLPFLPVPFKPKISSTKGKSSLERMKKAPLSWLLIFPDSFSPIPCCSAAVKFVVSAVRITPALLKLRFLTIHQASGEAGRDPSTPKPPPNSCLGKKKNKKKICLEKVGFAARFFQGVCGFSACRRRRGGGVCSVGLNGDKRNALGFLGSWGQVWQEQALHFWRCEQKSTAQGALRS